MLRSLYTAISGLEAHQQMLDVTANNIANVNTGGYKSSSVVFEDTLSQTMSTSGSGNDQVGLGVRVAGTVTNLAQGSAQSTGVPSNLMIQGDGYFVVSHNGQTAYTRNGAFSLDQSGHLVTPDGSILQGPDGAPVDLSALVGGGYASYSIDQSGAIKGVKSDGTVTTLGQVGMATFANPDGLQKIGDSEFSATAASGAAQVGTPGSNGRGSLMSGYLEMSNVDLSRELTNLIVAQRGFQANSKVITTSDEILQTLVSMKN